MNRYFKMQTPQAPPSGGCSSPLWAKFATETLKAVLAIMCVVFCACSSDSDDSPTVWMPIEISLPAEQFVSPHDFETTAGEGGSRSTDSVTRADTETEETEKPGDPGTYETFAFPQYLYAFAVIELKDGTTKVRTTMQELDGTKWEPTTTNSEYTSGDDIYTYQGTVGIDIDEDREKIRVYVAVCDKDLKEKLTLSNTSPSTEDDVKAITASFGEDKEGNMPDLRNFYSTPYNLYKYKSGNTYVYTTDATTNGAEYYGTVEDVSSQQPHIDNLILYHVAAKLDLKWNVDSAKQSSVNVPYIGLSNLKNSGAYIFQPMKNVDNVGSESTKGVLGVETTAGNKWYGRKSFYVIPYRTSSSSTTFPVTLKLRNETNNEYTTEIDKINAFSSSTLVFTPWIRGNIKINGTY